MPRPWRLLSVVVASFGLLVSTPRAQQAGIDVAALRTRVEGALANAPANVQRLLSPSQVGVRLLAVDVSQTAPGAQRIAIDLSQRALTYEPSGDIEPLLDHIIQATTPAVGATPLVEYRFSIDGLPLQQFLSQPPTRLGARGRSLAEGGLVIVSPGHGFFWDYATGTWHLQRPRINGIVEDLVNWDVSRYLRDGLLAANVNAQMIRYAEQDDSLGPSGWPRWQEAAKYFVQAIGAPSDTWNTGVDDYARDINARPFYANWVDASLLVSIHNNGGAETGTETWYDATNGQEPDSRRLAEIVNAHIVSAIRSRYDANWVDRGLRTCNGCKGETRLAARPAVIVEAAFVDTLVPDNAALHDDAFKRIVADAVRDAVLEWAAYR